MRSTRETQRELIAAMNLIGAHCDKLPEGWEIEIRIDNSEMSIVLLDPDGREVVDENDDSDLSSLEWFCEVAIEMEAIR